MNGWLSFWPERASAYAGRIDALMWSFTGVVALLTAPVLILILVFAIKYRRGKPANRAMKPERDVLIEVSWTVVPFLMTIGFFVYAALLFFQLHAPPPGAMVINVVGKQWMWKFQHPGGQAEINDLHVPADQPIELVMTSQDVIHSLFLPALRIKQDVLPGRYTSLWFKADKPGTYRLECAQFCGMDHSLMIGTFQVLGPADYARWLATQAASQTLAQQGAALYRSAGCSACHEPGSTTPAPSLAGIYGAFIPLTDGSKVMADAQYIQDSLLLPNKQVVAGYSAIMPSYQASLDPGQVAALVAYLQSLAAKP